MRNDVSLSINSLPSCSAIHTRTVVSLAEGRISCSVHTSEYQAYCEAVSRFEFAELGAAQEDTVSNSLLAVRVRGLTIKRSASTSRTVPAG
jgi:hypothetical protein